MGTRVSIRELRNSTREVIQRAAAEGEITITNNGVPVATIRAIADDWSALIDRLFRQRDAVDTGWSAELERDDLASMGDLG